MIAKYFAKVTLAIVLIFLAGLGFFRKSEINSEVAMNGHSKKINDIFSKTRTICFGRFLLDVPFQAIVVYGPASIESEIWFKKNGAEWIEKIVSDRLSEIKEEASYIPSYETVALPLIGKVEDGVKVGQKILFGAVNSVGYVIDSIIPIGNDLFIQRFGPVPPQVDYRLRINEIASNISLREEGEIPLRAGICIEGGFVALTPIRERVTIGLRFHEFPDVRFSIDAHKNQGRLPSGSSPSKLRDSARLEAEALGVESFFTRIKVLRDGSRQLGSWEGEELATRRPAYKDNTDAHEFRFYSKGAANDVLNPELDIRLDSGVHGNAKAKLKPSITDEEALEIWDRIIDTIRIRQTSNASLSKQQVERTMLGARVKSGEPCSQTGTWECVTKKNVVNKRERRFIEGEKMPTALVKGGGGLWRILLGDKNHFAHVEWRLAQYDEDVRDGSN